MSTSTEVDSVKILVDKALVVRPALEVTTIQDAITTPTSEALVVTSEMRQLLSPLAPVLLGGTSALPLISKSPSVTIVETGSRSALLVPTLAMDILEELTL